MARADYRHVSESRQTTRCAIYTRKSTEDGLDQAFNSLDAQREACAAYVLSQRHEGWVLVPGYYVDGGYSGGNLERPGLRSLLEEVRADRVDVIVVYKVDRLTRALADFAKIVETLDAANASFVSVTQAFNTTTSMGRLTLNVLLSFAQFEREVTGERIRDKIAASKKKGMWMGGVVPLGYEVHNRKLVVNEVDAAQVRFMFERFLALGTVAALQEELAASHIHSKLRRAGNGRTFGGTVITYGALSHLIQNRTYVGEVHHRGQHFPGEHAAIVDFGIFERAQQQMNENRVTRRDGRNIIDPSLLLGLLFDSQGRRMSPSHACKGSRRYRYYVSRPDPDLAHPLTRIPAGEVENAVVNQLVSAYSDPDLLHSLIEDLQDSRAPVEQVAIMMKDIVARLSDGSNSQRRALLRVLVRRVDFSQTTLKVAARVPTLNGYDPSGVTPPEGPPSRELSLTIPVSAARIAGEVRLIIAPRSQPSEINYDPPLIDLVTKAWMARQALKLEPDGSVAASAAEMGLEEDYFRVLLKISFLAPDILSAIVNGRQPRSLTRQKLARMKGVPMDWEAQRVALGFAFEH